MSRQSLPASALAPVYQHERVTKLLDALVMGGIACDQLQAVLQGYGGDHRIGAADRLAGAVEVAGNAASQLGGVLSKSNDLLAGDGGQEALQPPKALLAMEPAHDLHNGDDGNRVTAESAAIGGGVAGNVAVKSLADLRQDVGVEQRLIHRGRAARVVAPGTSWPRRRSRPSHRPRPA